MFPPQWLTPVPTDAIEQGEGELVIDFIEGFGIITKDSVAGKQGERLTLRDWQKDLIRHIYASDGQGFRSRVNLIGMPRKSGKSAIASAMAIFDTYFGPAGGETYSVAATREQARIVFSDAKRIVEANDELLKLAKLYRDAIEIPSTGSIYRVLSAEAFSAEGLNISACWFDELHAQPNRELFDVMSLAMGARGSLAHLVAITTAGVKTDSTGQDSIAFSLYNYGKRVASGEVEDLFPEDSIQDEYSDLVEAIVVIANDGVLLKAEKNPYMMKDRPILAYQDDTDKDQVACLKMCMDRLLPVSHFEKQGQGRSNAIQVQIVTTGAPQIAARETEVNYEVIDMEAPDGESES